MSSVNNNVSAEEVQNYKNGRTVSMRRHFFAAKIHKLTKMLKPVARLMSRRSAVAPAPRAADDVPTPEDIQNAVNEALEARLQEDMFVSAGVQGDAIQSVADGEVTLVAVVPGLLVPVPASFLSLAPGRFSWVQIPAPDSDICPRGDSQPLTLDQVPQQQTPVSA